MSVKCNKFAMFRAIMSPIPIHRLRLRCITNECLMERTIESTVRSVISSDPYQRTTGLLCLRTMPGRGKVVPRIIRRSELFREDVVRVVFNILCQVPRKQYLEGIDDIFANPNFCLRDGRYPPFRFKRAVCDRMVWNDSTPPSTVEAIVMYMHAVSIGKHGAKYVAHCLTRVGRSLIEACDPQTKMRIHLVLENVFWPWV